MNIASQPARLCPAFPRTLYGVVTNSEQEIGDVEIYDSVGTTRLGVKRVKGEGTHFINVTPYIAAQENILPIQSHTSKLIAPIGRIINSNIKIEDTLYSTPHTLGTATIAQNDKIISDFPTVKNIFADGSDEFSFIASGGDYSAAITLYRSGGNSTEIALNTVNASENTMLSMVVKASHIAEILQKSGTRIADYSHFDAEIKRGGSKIISVRYNIKSQNPDCATLYWLNRYGAIDCFAFERVKNAELVCEKKRGQRAGKTAIVENFSHKKYHLVSPPERAAVVQTVAEVAASVKVWMVYRGETEAVDVTSDATLVAGINSKSIELSLCTIEKNVAQNL